MQPKNSVVVNYLEKMQFDKNAQTWVLKVKRPRGFAFFPLHRCIYETTAKCFLAGVTDCLIVLNFFSRLFGLFGFCSTALANNLDLCARETLLQWLLSCLIQKPFTYMSVSHVLSRTYAHTRTHTHSRSVISFGFIQYL